MKSASPLLLALVFLISSPLANGSDFFIKYVIGKGKGSTAFPVLSVPGNGVATAQMNVPLNFVTKWDLPGKGKTPDGIKMALPPTPKEFRTAKSGWIIECKAEPMEGGLVRITGMATYSEPERTQGVYGEHSWPKADSFVMHSSATPFQVFALPGKPYMIEVKALNKTMPLNLTCSYQK